MKARVKYENQRLAELLLELREINENNESLITEGTTGPFERVTTEEQKSKILNLLKNHPTVIYGDFDADGLTSSSISQLALPEADIYVPSRESGYGLSEYAIRLIDTNSLIVSVDCGISFLEEAEELEKEGYKFVITDHHETPVYDRKFTFPVINPKYTKNGYRFLSGAGVALLMFAELDLLGPETFNSAIQLATIGTIADMVPVLGDNRRIVARGLELMRNDPMPAVVGLAKATGIQVPYIDEESIAWYFGPLLNSSTRMDEMDTAIELLTTDDFDVATNAARILKNARNREKTIIKNNQISLEKTASILELPNINLVDARKLDNVVTGTTANRVGQEYGYPVMVYTQRNGTITASIRCNTSFNAFRLIKELESSNLISGGGGHKEAAGFHCEKELLEEVIEYVINYADSNTGEEEEIYDADIEIDFWRLLNMFEEVESLKPYGMGFQKPVFLTTINGFDSFRTMGKEKEHCAFSVFGVECVAFGLGDKIKEDSGAIEVVCELSRNASYYGEGGSKQLMIRDAEVVE